MGLSISVRIRGKEEKGKEEKEKRGKKRKGEKKNRGKEEKRKHEELGRMVPTWLVGLEPPESLPK